MADNTTNQGDDGAVLAKGLSIVFLFLLTIGLGASSLIVLKVGDAKSKKRQRVVGYLNSFAGGVFLGACLLHLLAEGAEEMENYLSSVGFDFEYPFYEVLVVGGILAVMMTEQIALLCMNKSGDEVISISRTVGPQGSVNEGLEVEEAKPDHHQATEESVPSDTTTYTCSNHDIVEIVGHTHGGSQDFSETSGLRAFLLLTALSFHTIFDGLAVGLQSTTSRVWQMFAAVAVHKSLVAFCLGLALFRSMWHGRPKTAMGCLMFFALMAPIGVAIGIVVTSTNIDKVPRTLVSAILQGLATGTFFYVTFLEILREEFGHCKRSFIKVFLVAVGFGAMAGVKLLDKD